MHYPEKLSPEQFERLLAEARAGGTEALGTLLEACRRYLLRVGSLHLPPELRPKISASDLVQDVLVEALRGFVRFRGNTQGELLGWLRAIVVNLARKLTRQYRYTSSPEVARELSLEATAFLHTRLLSDASGPLIEAIAREEIESLRAALGRLPADYREVIRLRSEEGLPFGEVGVLLNRSAEAARKFWDRALQCVVLELVAAESGALNLR